MTSSLSVNSPSQLSDRDKIRDFQIKIYLKAKQEPDVRFHSLYDKLCSMRFLREAYRRVKAKKGGPGVDGVDFEAIEAQGVDNFLLALQHELQTKTYRPLPVKRKYVPKANGKLRPLGIPTIKDRVAQMSCKVVIEPIFEADFEATSHGSRPKRSAKDAIKQIKGHLQAGRTQVFDADLSQYFDTIPHDKMLILLGRRISDGPTLHLIKLWLKAPIVEDGKLSGGKKNRLGTPQGGVISPLLANIYLTIVDKMINRINGLFSRLGIKIVRYADDFVLMGHAIPKVVLDKLKNALSRMELNLNEDKSHQVDACQMPFDFLGFTIRYDKDRFGRNQRYWNIIPSSKSCRKGRDTIREFLRKSGHYPPDKLAKELNAKLRGWINYYTIPKVSYLQKAKRDLRCYLKKKLNRYFYRKSQRKCKLYRQHAFEKLVKKYNLIDPSKYKPVVAL